VRPIVEFAGVTRIYGSRVALDDVHLELLPGELTFLVGPSGAGKTTLLKLINRELRPTSGRLWVAGLAAHTLKASRVAELRRRVGVVFQDYKLLPRLTALENVAFGLQAGDLRVSDDEARDRSQDALDAVGLGDRGDAFPHQLSGGQQQRVAVARALVGDPLILMADEPTGNLDSKNGEAVMELLRDLHRNGATICMVTHDQRYSHFAERTIRLFDGRIIEESKEVHAAV